LNQCLVAINGLQLSERQRKIIHVDMDAFYASIEQRDFPEYRNKPLAVGGSEKRGVVAAASYEARKYGVYSALPSKIAAQKCPHLIFVKPRFEVYRYESLRIREIFHEFTDLVEPLALDEAYLDVTLNKRDIDSAIKIGRLIKEKIKNETALTASIGVSNSKFMAKIASDYKKPNGFFVILPKDVDQFIENLPIQKFHGIGEVMAKKMRDLEIFNGKDLKQKDQLFLIQHFGKMGVYYHDIAHGNDHRPVNPNRKRKSVSAENTFPEDLITKKEVIGELEKLSLQVSNRLKKSGKAGKTITIKIRFSDFNTITRSKSLPSHHDEPEIIKNTAVNMYLSLQDLPLAQGIRLLGVGVANFSDDENGKQLSFEF